MSASRPDAPAPSEYRFFHPLRVRWAEVDPQGIVFNPNYFVYADVGMTEYLREIGFAYPEGFSPFGTDLFAVNATANFRASARFDDELQLGVRVAHLGRTSVRFSVGVFREEKLLVDVTLIYANADAETRAPAPLPEPFVRKVLDFEPAAPSRG